MKAEYARKELPSEVHTCQTAIREAKLFGDDKQECV